MTSPKYSSRHFSENALPPPSTLKTFSHSLVVVPGFLTEIPSLSSPSSKNHPLENIAHQVQSAAIKEGKSNPLGLFDSRDWESKIKPIKKESTYLHTFQWPSSTVLDLVQNHLLPLIQDGFSLFTDLYHFRKSSYEHLRQIHKTWRSALAQADASVQSLYTQLHYLLTQTPPDHTITVLGHSLGGRMTLKVFDLCLRNLTPRDFKRLRWVSWAAAITKPQLPSSLLHPSSRSSPSYPLEIAFSDHDQVLKYLYPLGQMVFTSSPVLDFTQVSLILVKETRTPSPIIGYLGLKDPQIQLRQFDLSQHGVGHLNYLPLFKDLAYKSPLLAPLML